MKMMKKMMGFGKNDGFAGRRFTSRTGLSMKLVNLRVGFIRENLRNPTQIRKFHHCESKLFTRGIIFLGKSGA